MNDFAARERPHAIVVKAPPSKWLNYCGLQQTSEIFRQWFFFLSAGNTPSNTFKVWFGLFCLAAMRGRRDSTRRVCRTCRAKIQEEKERNKKGVLLLSFIFLPPKGERVALIYLAQFFLRVFFFLFFPERFCQNTIVRFSARANIAQTSHCARASRLENALLIAPCVLLFFLLSPSLFCVDILSGRKKKSFSQECVMGPRATDVTMTSQVSGIYTHCSPQ